MILIELAGLLVIFVASKLHQFLEIDGNSIYKRPPSILRRLDAAEQPTAAVDPRAVPEADVLLPLEQGLNGKIAHFLRRLFPISLLI
jgi:hypothetical protein